jgi:hypothetical protein
VASYPGFLGESISSPSACDGSPIVEDQWSIGYVAWEFRGAISRGGCKVAVYGEEEKLGILIEEFLSAGLFGYK